MVNKRFPNQNLKRNPQPRVVNDLDVAYAEIPEAERTTWYERADRALEAAGMPEWMRITPTVKEMALRMWVGTTIPGTATGEQQLALAAGVKWLRYFVRTEISTMQTGGVNQCHQIAKASHPASPA
jgi:hypothetical protein